MHPLTREPSGIASSKSDARPLHDTWPMRTSASSAKPYVTTLAADLRASCTKSGLSAQTTTGLPSGTDDMNSAKSSQISSTFS